MKINACVRVMQDGDSGVGGIVMIDHREGCAGGEATNYMPEVEERMMNKRGEMERRRG